MYCWLILASFIAIYVASQKKDCDYGEFTLINNTCMFDCEYDGRYVQLSTLSFEFIRAHCGYWSVDTVANLYPLQCNSTSDLVYSSNSCGCPFCKCSSRNDRGTTKTHFNLDSTHMSKTCYNCTCSESSDNSITDLIYNCDDLEEVWMPSEWNEFECPPNFNTCATPSGWDMDSNGECTKLCNCNSDGSTTCEEGFANILASSDDNLINIFLSCASSTADCMDDPSRMQPFWYGNMPQYCGNCPGCDCGTHSLNDSWYTEYHSYDDIQNNRITCAKCTCVEASNGNNYAECDGVDEYVIGTGSCPVAITHQCHQQESYSETVETLSTEGCSNDDEILILEFRGSGKYCQWSANFDYPDYEPYIWWCGQNMFCEAFADNKCIHIEYNDTYTRCGDLFNEPKMRNFNTYEYCCNTGDNCNRENIDISSCSKGTAYENMILSYQECLWRENSIYKKYTCDENINEMSCTDLQEFYISQAECQCNLATTIYNRVGSTSQIQIEKFIDATFSAWYSRWNDAFGCDINLKCNLPKDRVIINESTTTAIPGTTSTIAYTNTIQITESVSTKTPTDSGEIDKSKGVDIDKLVVDMWILVVAMSMIINIK
eukprot:400321_1